MGAVEEIFSQYLRIRGHSLAVVHAEHGAIELVDGGQPGAKARVHLASGQIWRVQALDVPPLQRHLHADMQCDLPGAIYIQTAHRISEGH